MCSMTKQETCDIVQSKTIFSYRMSYYMYITTLSMDWKSEGWRNTTNNKDKC